MSVQPCPHCGRRGMTWSLDEVVSPLTEWRCAFCHYRAEEDESQESTCPACGAPGSRVLLSDTDGRYWFCFSCQLRSPGEDVS